MEELENAGTQPLTHIPDIQHSKKGEKWLIF